MRRCLDSWLGHLKVTPRVVAEFYDSGLLTVAGSHGDGLMPIPSIIANEIAQHYRVEVVGVAEGLVESYYAISAQRQIAHPTVLAIVDSAGQLTLGPRRLQLDVGCLPPPPTYGGCLHDRLGLPLSGLARCFMPIAPADLSFSDLATPSWVVLSNNSCRHAYPH